MTTSTVPANTMFPAETLELGEGGGGGGGGGGDLLPGPYPVINAGMLTIGAGVGVFLGVVRIDGVNGSTEEVASNTQFYRPLLIPGHLLISTCYQLMEEGFTVFNTQWIVLLASLELTAMNFGIPHLLA